jgi:hypothetical protein
MASGGLCVLSVPVDTHYEYPEDQTSSTMAKKMGNLSYAQLVLLLSQCGKHDIQVGRKIEGVLKCDGGER